MARVSSKASSSRQKELRFWLENEILDGRLCPGDAIDEQSVCVRFGVSRTPVRESLLQLASLELIEFRPRYGAIVKQMSVKEIAAIWEVLTSLESLAAGLAARRMTAEDRASLELFHRNSRPYLTAGDVDGYDAANKSFHETIYRGCRNEYLSNQVMTIRRRLQPYRRFPFHRPGGMQRSFGGHQLVLDAIKAGDEDRAVVAMREHVAGGLSFLDLIAEFPARDREAPKAEGEKVDAKGYATTRKRLPTRRGSAAAGRRQARSAKTAPGS
jgi:DNA-binding GntR family transcriptional regulator